MTAHGTFTRAVEADAFLRRVKKVVSNIDYRRDSYDLEVQADETGRVFIQIWHQRPDAETGRMTWGKGGKRFLSEHITDSEIVRVCFAAALAYEEHEVREFFTYKGARVFGPHLSVEALVEVAGRLDVRS